MTSPQPHRPGAQQGSAEEPIPGGPAPDDIGSAENTGFSGESGPFEDGPFEDGNSEEGNSEDFRDAVPSSALGEPWRLAVAGAELLAVVALVLLTWWAWGRGTVLVDVPGPAGGSGEQGGIRQVSRSVGNWQAASIGAAALAGLVLLDLCRQLWLAPRLRRGR